MPVSIFSGPTLAAQLEATNNRPSGFDYMRIVLALGVIFSHCRYLTNDETSGRMLWEPFMGPQSWKCFLGPIDFMLVPMFFALSGFLVAGSLERSKTLVTFLGLRVFRIVPALSVEVLLSALILGPLLTVLPLNQYFTDIKFYTYFLNIVGEIHYFLPGLFQSNYNTQVNLQLWTIPPELACYAGLSALAIFGIFKRRDWMLIFFVACYIAQIINVILRPDTEMIPSGSAKVILSFVAGLVIYKYRNTIRYSGFLCLLMAILSLAIIMMPNGSRLVALPVAYVTIYLGLLNPTRNRIILSGDYSYGLYLYGFPIQQALVAMGGPAAHHWYWNLICAVPAATVIAICSWWLVEKPALSQRQILKTFENWYLKVQPKWCATNLKQPGELNMKVSCLCFFAVFFATSIPTNAYAGWNMVFHDEFDGPTLNHDEWFTRGMASGDTLDHLNDEKEVYRDNNNHIFMDGHIALTARYIGDGKYESGMLRSKRSFYYGYFEGRIKLPSAKGVWPAFWFCSDYDDEGHTGWPPEVDIFEFANNAKDDTVFMVHSAVGNDDQVKPSYTDPKYSHNNYHSDVDMTKDWHVWGMMWLPDSISMYLDGKKLYSKPYKWTYANGQMAGPAYIILNLAIGGQWAGRYGIDNDVFPQSLDVDYVRVYQYDASKPNTVTSLPNVPDLASISYNGPGDLVRPTVYPAEIPPTVKPGSLMNVVYHIDSIPTKHRTKLRISITDSSGKSVYNQTAELPHDTRQEAMVMKARVGIALPSNLSDGDYDVRMALGYCPTVDCKPENFTNVPLTPMDGAVRESSAFYRVGRFKVDD